MKRLITALPQVVEMPLSNAIPYVTEYALTCTESEWSTLQRFAEQTHGDRRKSEFLLSVLGHVGRLTGHDISV